MIYVASGDEMKLPASDRHSMQLLTGNLFSCSLHLQLLCLRKFEMCKNLAVASDIPVVKLYVCECSP